MNDDRTVQTGRLILKEITEADTNFIVSVRSDPAIYRYFKNPFPLTIKEHLKWYKECYMVDKNFTSWIGYEFRYKKPVGIYSLRIIKKDIAEIGYLTAKDIQRKGYASEAVTAIERFAVISWNINLFLAEVHKKNTESINFIQSLGYAETRKKNEFLIFTKQLVR